MTNHSRLALVLGGVALPLLASLPVLAQQPPAPPAPPPSSAQPSRPGPSQADRAAFLDARIAAVHAGLRLTPDQEKLWPPLEKAVRDGMTKLADLRQQRRTAERPADPVEAMSRRAEADLTRGTAMKAIADAARPLYASLNPDQRRRLPLLMHVGRRDMGEHFDRDRRDRRMGPGPGDERGRGMMRRGDREDGPGWGRPDRDGPDRN